LVRSDADLVNAVLAGDKAAFETLVKRYELSVRALAAGILGDKHLASDVAQEAFVRAYEKLSSLRDKAVFGPWLLKIARRCALDMAGRIVKEQPLDTNFCVAARSGNGQLDSRKQQLLEAVLQLPKSEKQVVMLRYFGDRFASRSVKDVADIAGRNVSTVTKQLSRARRRLRNILSRSEVEL